MTSSPRKTPERFSTRRISIIVASVALSAACASDDVTQADSPLRAKPAEIRAARASVEDARSRLVPSLQGMITAGELTTRLVVLEQALRDGDADAVDRALTRADETVSRLRKLDTSASFADLDAIDLALADVRRLLTSTDTGTGAATSSDEDTTP